MNTLAALLGPPLLLVPLMGILGRLRGSTPLTQEIRRKTFHVAAGLLALSFPALFDETWMVFVALGLVLLWMLAVRIVAPLRARFGGCLHDTDRTTHGELYFALAAGYLLIVAGDTPVNYVIPILILAFADTAAAVVGAVRMGRPIGGIAGPKTYAGCSAFFVVAFAVTVPLLATVGTLPIGPAVAAGLLVAASTCIAEAVSHRGSDNLTVPVVAFIVLSSLGG